jgi:hypothetical protein
VDSSGQWEVGEDSSGMSVKVLSTGSRDNLGCFEGDVSSVEVSVGLARGDAGEKSAVVDDVSTASLTDDYSQLQWRFPSDEENRRELRGKRRQEY